jgi:hypothetical protein
VNPVGLNPQLSDFFTGLLMWEALSEERTGLPFTVAAVLARAVILGSESRGTRGHILLSQILDFPSRLQLTFLSMAL